ncbi:MAG TPA: SDR family NAD(P)-dependent oxidoreductase [Thermoanaerobaculia bacterium]|nr:SDR family NAD(P)-dependent oxidoreductase [Thermoanaerobaculia bacterium]
MNVAIITGGTSGLGAALTERLSKTMRVVTVSRREKADVSGDASRAGTVRRAIAAAEHLGTITLLVNCAGRGDFGRAGSYDEDRIRAIIDSNLVSTILFCDALFPRFARDGGTIVNVLSTAALIAKPNESVYCAAKWGARGYTDVLKAEAKGTKARVISVAPGGMQTPFWESPREGFMDPREIAAIIVDALERPVNVNSIVIERT